MAITAAVSEGIDTVTIRSANDDLSAEFAPGAGMVCCSLRAGDRELLAQRDGVRAYAERGATMGIPLLHPWANRLAGLCYRAAGEAVQLDRDSPLLAFDPHGLPIHGVIPRYLDWVLTTRTPDALRAQMSWEHPRLLAIFPFAHTLELSVSVAESTLTIDTNVRACGQATVPVCFGYHPYLTIAGTDRRDWVVELPAMRQLALDRRMIPTGAGSPFARVPFRLADEGFDDAFEGAAQPLRFSASAGDRRIELEFLEGYRFAQVYSPAGADFICFEPMTAPANALVSGADLPTLAPGQEHRASFAIAVRT